MILGSSSRSLVTSKQEVVETTPNLLTSSNSLVIIASEDNDDSAETIIITNSQNQILKEDADTLYEGLSSIFAEEQVMMLINNEQINHNGFIIGIEDAISIIETNGFVIHDKDCIIREIVSGQGDFSNYYNKKETVQIINQMIEASVGNGLNYMSEKINMNQNYIDYLDSMLYQKPSISFSLQDFPTSYIEMGYIYSGEKTLTLRIQNESNLNESLYVKGLGIDSTLTKELTHKLNFNYVVSSIGSRSITVSGTDVKNNNITASLSFSSVYPIYAGASVQVLDSINLNKLDKIMQSGVTLSRTIKPLANARYVWFCVQQNYSISNFEANGFSATFEDPIIIETTNINGITVNYKCYRSSDPLVAGENYNFKIS